MGILNFKQLVNESMYHRSDNFANLSKNILRFFPQFGRSHINSEVNYKSEYPTQNLKLAHHKNITVKSLRKTFCESLLDALHPYTNYNKFQLTVMDAFIHNPFSHIIK